MYRTRYCPKGHDKDVIGRSSRGSCLKCKRDLYNEWARKNSSYKSNYMKEWRKNNPGYSARYHKRRRSSEILYKLASNIRTRVASVSKNIGIPKKSSMIKWLGCTVVDFKKHIEDKFSSGMVWDNYGSWEIDHIIPLSSASNRESLLELAHYTNTQPLWVSDNRSKKDKMPT